MLRRRVLALLIGIQKALQAICRSCGKAAGLVLREDNHKFLTFLFSSSPLPQTCVDRLEFQVLPKLESCSQGTGTLKQGEQIQDAPSAKMGIIASARAAKPSAEKISHNSIATPFSNHEIFNPPSSSHRASS